MSRVIDTGVNKGFETFGWEVMGMIKTMTRIKTREVVETKVMGEVLIEDRGSWSNSLLDEVQEKDRPG